MNTNWMIGTHGDPLGALQKFIKTLWEQTDLDVIVVAPNGHGFLLESPDELEHMNPFRPLMKLNTARLVVDTAKKRPGKRVGAMLRPCEMRALNEMAARGALRRDDVLAVCTDCLGTFPADEFEWRTERSEKGLTKDTLQFAPQGGISAYRYRPACQMCAEPGATDGDVNVGVFGLPVRQFVLVNAHKEGLTLESMTNGLADDELVSKREHTLGKISERHVRTRERVLKSLDENLPADVQELLLQFESCDECQACMNVCPICTVDQPRKDDTGKLVREDVVSWLLSCAGCGMCEQACPQYQPLSAVFSHIREQVEAELAL
ncbi:MAG: 4Fe-4S dicluster domain-containing protein [Anaerolineales bacterium]